MYICICSKDAIIRYYIRYSLAFDFAFACDHEDSICTLNLYIKFKSLSALINFLMHKWFEKDSSPGFPSKILSSRAELFFRKQGI